MTSRPLKLLRSCLGALSIVLLGVLAMASWGSAAAAAATSSDPPAPAGDFVAHQVIVAFAPSASPAERGRLRGHLDVKSAEGLGGGNASLYRLPADVSVAEALEELRGSDAVAYAEPNGISHAASIPNDPLFSSQWALRNTGQTISSTPGVAGADIGATRAWDVTTGSPSVTVAVIDSGIDLAHGQLSSRLWTNPGESGGGKESNGADDDTDGFTDDLHGWDFAESDATPQDTLGHGTNMSGIAAAAGNDGVEMTGVAQDVRLMPLRVGITNSFPDSNIVSAINFAGSHGAQVVNMSFEGPNDVSITAAINSYPGTLFVAAAGNQHSSSFSYPCAASASNLLCDAATNNRDELAGFSNYNATSVDIGAPGVSILPTALNGGTTFGQGTSQATAVTSGAMALYRSQYPSATPPEVIQRIKETVDPVPALAGKTVTGGRLDIGNALDFTPPDTTITGAPPDPGNDSTPPFSFTSTDVNSTFECQVDGGGWSSCQSGASLAPLGDGSHNFEVRAVDGGGNTDPTPASDSFTIDTAAPDTTIQSGPAATEKAATATFTFHSADATATFQCSLDEDPEWDACPEAGYELIGLTDGSHTLHVRAVDPAGNVDPTPDSWAWVVDVDLPVTTITQEPPSLTKSTSATFSFEATEPATFECQRDGADWKPCISPFTLTSLSDGQHSFSVRAIDSAANQETSPPAVSWEVDLTPPQTTIESGPPTTTNSSEASFSFEASEPSTFECQVDSGGWQGCTSPMSYSSISAGAQHHFSVRATDAAGNHETSPPTYTWSVNPPPSETTEGQGPTVISLPTHEGLPSGPRGPVSAQPDTIIAKHPPHRTRKRRVTFVLEGGASYRYRVDRGKWKTASAARLTLALQPGSHQLLFQAMDAAGALDPAPAGFGIVITKW